MAIFNSYVTNYQRVYIGIVFQIVGMEIFTHDLHKYVRHSYRCRSSIDYEYMLYVHVYGGGEKNI